MTDRSFRRFLPFFTLLISLFLVKSAYAYEKYFLPFYQHQLSSFQTTGDFLEFDDGSIWRVYPSYRSTVLYWTPGDILELSQSTNNLKASYRFWITNKTKKNYILAEVSQGPILRHYDTQHLSDLNYNQIKVVSGAGLETRWSIDPKDLPLMTSWKKHQTIIIGINNSWLVWFSGYDHLLFNVEKNQFIRAKMQ